MTSAKPRYAGEQCRALRSNAPKQPLVGSNWNVRMLNNMNQTPDVAFPRHTQWTYFEKYESSCYRMLPTRGTLSEHRTQVRML